MGKARPPPSPGRSRATAQGEVHESTKETGRAYSGHLRATWTWSRCCSSVGGLVSQSGRRVVGAVRVSRADQATGLCFGRGRLVGGSGGGVEESGLRPWFIVSRVERFLNSPGLFRLEYLSRQELALISRCAVRRFGTSAAWLSRWALGIRILCNPDQSGSCLFPSHWRLIFYFASFFTGHSTGIGPLW